jgi:hypothetical protein
MHRLRLTCGKHVITRFGMPYLPYSLTTVYSKSSTMARFHLRTALHVYDSGWRSIAEGVVFQSFR